MSEAPTPLDTTEMLVDALTVWAQHIGRLSAVPYCLIGRLPTGQVVYCAPPAEVLPPPEVALVATEVAREILQGIVSQARELESLPPAGAVGT